MESGLLLDVIVGESATVLQLLSSEDETLLVRRNAFLILDLCFYIVDGIAGFDLKSDSLASDYMVN